MVIQFYVKFSLEVKIVTSFYFVYRNFEGFFAMYFTPRKCQKNIEEF